MDRIEKVLSFFQTALIETVSSETDGMGIACPRTEEIISVFYDADPTKAKKYFRWLVETYINDGFFWEDIERGHESSIGCLLRDFETYKKHLQAEYRSIMKYRSIGDLNKALFPLINTAIPCSEKRTDRERAYREALIMKPSDFGIHSIVSWHIKMKVVSPLTEFSSCWWGRGTMWCTAATRSKNYFEFYNNRAPLYIIILNDGTRLQFFEHKETETLQIMDAHDSVVTSETISQYWMELKELMSCFDSNESLKYWPSDLVTQEYCEQVFAQKKYLKNIPKDMITQDMMQVAVMNKMNVLYIPPSLLRKYSLADSSDFPDVMLKDNVLNHQSTILTLLQSRRHT